MEIRVLTAEDAEIYREIRLRSLKENPEAFLTTYEREQNLPIEELRQKIKATEHQFTLGAFMDGELAGIVTFVRESRTKISHKGNVYAMYVSPEFRKTGIAKALVRRLIEKAKQLEGLEQINLAVITANKGAKRLYEAAGFITYGMEHNALKAGGQYWDEDFMVLRLN